MLNNNGFGGNNYYGGGYGYQQPYAPAGTMYNNKQLNMNTLLTADELKALKSKGGVNLKITSEEHAKALCTHRNNNTWATTQNPDGSVTCNICGEKFNLLEESELKNGQIHRKIQDALDVLNSIKLYWIDVPVTAGREYFQIIPILKKAEQLFPIAVNSFNQHFGQPSVNNTYGPSDFAMYDMISGYSPMYGQPQQGYGYQPQGGFGYQQQSYGYQPQQNYGGYQAGYQPQGGFGYQPPQQNMPFQSAAMNGVNSGCIGGTVPATNNNSFYSNNANENNGVNNDVVRRPQQDSTDKVKVTKQLSL